MKVALILFLLVFTSYSANARQRRECKYPNYIFLEPGKTDNGEPIKEYSRLKHPRAFSGWKYESILFCQRPDSSQYIIVTDFNKVSSPPQEILNVKIENNWERLQINRKFAEGPEQKPLLILRWAGALNGNPDSIFVFLSNEHMMDGMYLFDGFLTLSWKK